MPSDTCKILLVYPQFRAASFWNFKATCEIAGARYPAPPLGLITMAALLPRAWDVRLVDRNVETLTDADIDGADLVMTGGMLPQQEDTLHIIDRCHNRGKPVAVGGPDLTSSPHMYDGADFQIRGEAEPVMQQFVDAWTAGARRGVFEAEKFSADVTQTPIPRFDLLRFRNYLYVNVQFSRGCPFNCEFCDIIELYGRKPRTKTNAQMLAELDALYALGYRGHVDFVDDNLIGNKKAVKQFLPQLIAWQRERRYPFEFSTEASINLADDDQLLGMMRDANFFGLFIGIESPDPATLVAMQKKQNTRRDLAASVNKVYGAGMFVVAGFIVGFDSEKDRIAEQMIECIEATSIPVCMVGLLFALPNTQLTRRLQKEGRLHAGFDITDAKIGGDQCTAGLNFTTLRSRRDILTDYVQVLRSIYRPADYFARTRRVARALKRPMLGPISRKQLMIDLYRLVKLVATMAFRHPALLPHFFKTFAECARHNPAALNQVVKIMALYLHLGPFSRMVVEQIERQVAEIDRGAWTAPPLVPVIATTPQSPVLEVAQG
jgi:radical SAM superfamily enzyme YgiQ (UPF0313 family)